MHDGVVFRHSPDEFLLTAARPALSWFQELGSGLRVELEDVTDAYGMLAVQGPRSRTVLSALVPEAETLGYFDHVPAKVGGAAVTLSRTGDAGNLGFELTVPADDAVAVLDAVLEAGRDHSIRPFGEEALMTLRIEAGLALIDVEWEDARLAFSEADCVTPKELGVRLDAARRPGRVAPLRRCRGDPARAGRRHVALADERHRRRLGGLGPAVPRRRPVPAQVRAPAALRVDDPRRRPQRGRLLHVVRVLAGAPASHRHRPGAAEDLAAEGTDLRLELAIAHHNTTVRVRDHEDAVLRPREGRRQ